MDDAARAKADDRVAQDIAQRLGRACAHLSPAEFDSLVADLVAMKWRFRAIERNPALWCHARDHPGAPNTEIRDWPPVRVRPHRDD
jgi:hypothetical protein